jgi:hypothetical protein
MAAKIDVKELKIYLRKLGIWLITLSVIGLMLQGIKDFNMYGIQTLSIVLLVVGIVMWIVGLIKFSKI